MLNFVLIGAAGYVAPRHMKAIKDLGGNLIAAYDPHDSVGVLDSYFSDCSFFTEFERFDRFCEKAMDGQGIDYVSICSPNYLHDAHCRFALRLGADAICEKPLCLNERNIDALQRIELKTHGKINTILQLRLSDEAMRLKEKYSDGNYCNVNIDYVTPRGKWYQHSWKGDVSKSGGLPTNIGIHLFDLMGWLFGKLDHSGLMRDEPSEVTGFLDLQYAHVDWRISIKNEPPQRLIKIDDQDEIDLSNGFQSLHTKSYQNIIDGKGFSCEDARPAIKIVEGIRNAINPRSNL
jgi:UDP-N-acetyl-2-amino-2-deoxyglucuronate dehydrogenase